MLLSAIRVFSSFEEFINGRRYPGSKSISLIIIAEYVLQGIFVVGTKTVEIKKTKGKVKSTVE
jgi:hypothetical protein